MMLKEIIVFTSLLLPLTANSAEVVASEILYIAPWTNHVDIKMNATFVSQNCGAPEDFYRIEFSETMSSQAKYSTLLAAFMAGKKVGLSIDGCIGDRPKVVGIRFSR